MTNDYSGPEGSGSLVSKTAYTSSAVAYFANTDAQGYTGLWATTGTAAGTYEVEGAALQYGSMASLDPSSLTAFLGDVLFVGADGGSNGLFISDGTAAGTREIAGLALQQQQTNAGLAVTAPWVADITGLTVFGNRHCSTPKMLTVISSCGPRMGQLQAPTNSQTYSRPQIFCPGWILYVITPFGSVALFVSSQVNSNMSIWVTDGTAAGTYELTGVAGAYADGVIPTFYSNGFLPLGNEALFEGENAAGQMGLWETDGTAQGTKEIAGISNAFSGGILFGGAAQFVAFNGEALFRGYDAAGMPGLWVSNGTAAGTYELSGINGASAAGIMPADFGVLGNEVLFLGIDAKNAFSLWVTDGTAAGTRELTGIQGLYIPGLGFDPHFTDVNGQVLFEDLTLATIWVFG